MRYLVDVLVDPEAGESPPPGTPVRVELRDTSLADAPAVVLARAEGVVSDEPGQCLTTVELESDAQRPTAGLTVRAHVPVAGSESVSPGDYVTMQSHPVPSPEQQPGRLAVTVRPVR